MRGRQVTLPGLAVTLPGRGVTSLKSFCLLLGSNRRYTRSIASPLEKKKIFLSRAYMRNSMSDIDDWDDMPDDLHGRGVPDLGRGAKVVVERVFDPRYFDFRLVVRTSMDKFDDEAKAIFLEEFSKHGRIGKSATVAGVTPNTVKRHAENDEEFSAAWAMAEELYKDRLIEHHQKLVFEGTTKKTYDRNGNIIAEETQYPIPLIQMELRKHDEGYRDKKEFTHNVGGGVLAAPPEVDSVDEWEKKFGGKTIEGEAESADKKSPTEKLDEEEGRG